MSKVRLAINVFVSYVTLYAKKVTSTGLHFKGIVIKGKKVKIAIGKNGRIILDKRVKLDSGCELSSNNEIEIGMGTEIGCGTALVATKSGIIHIGENSFLNRNCTIVSCESISIGSGTAIGYNVVILDHDHYYVKEGKQPWNDIKTAPVVIGNNVWIGANVTILAGTKIGDNAVIAAGSIIKGEVSGSTLVLQKRKTEYREIQS